jgi:hypothetical protein
MPSTLGLSCSKKLYELLGETYETEMHWKCHHFFKPFLTENRESDQDWEGQRNEPESERFRYIQAPSFSETIRLLPKIAKRKGWKDYECPLFFQDVGAIYMSAPTEEEGMKQVSDYLEALL